MNETKGQTRPESPEGPASQGAAIALLLLAAGLLLNFHPMILSGFSTLQSDTGDTVFCVYVLEHGFRWISGFAAHPSFWDAPFFYPARNVIAYSDTFLGAAPLYWLLRWSGAGIWTAYPLWLMATSALNFAAMRVFLRRGAGTGATAASLGAFLFAFATGRIHQAAHVQLFPHYFLPLAALALIRIHQGRDQALGWRGWSWCALAASCFALQFYAGFYLGWLTLLGLMVFSLYSLARASTRREALSLVSRRWVPWALAAAAAGALLYPLATHYLAAAHEVGMRSLKDVFEPHIQSWIYMGTGTWLYGWQDKVRMFEVLDGNEHRIGVGLVAFVLAVQGLWRSRRRPWIGALGAATLMVALLTTSFFGKVYLWPHLYRLIPGGEAIRALTRVALLALFAFSVGLALQFDVFFARRGRWRLLAPALALIVVLEQGTTTASFSLAEWSARVDQVAARVGPGCASFYKMTGEDWTSDNLLAMWAALRLEDRPGSRLVGTINGFSGNAPRGWFAGVAGPERVRAAFDQWVSSHGMDPKTSCWIN